MKTRSTRVNYSQLQKKLEEAVQKCIPPNAKFGIAFSGGIDSATIAYVARKFSKNGILLVVGMPGSQDVSRAEALAKKWKMKLIKKELNAKELAMNYSLAGKILHTKDHLQQTLGAINLSIAKLAHAQGVETLLVGSGADELFCGYALFEKVRDNPKECELLRKQKVENVEEHDVKREKKCGKHYGIVVRAPYLDEAFQKEAMSIPAIQNLHGKHGKWRKNVLRMLAEKMGLPLNVVQAPKKAMQYGSGATKTLKTK